MSQPVGGEVRELSERGLVIHLLDQRELVGRANHRRHCAGRRVAPRVLAGHVDVEVVHVMLDAGDAHTARGERADELLQKAWSCPSRSCRRPRRRERSRECQSRWNRPLSGGSMPAREILEAPEVAVVDLDALPCRRPHRRPCRALPVSSANLRRTGHVTLPSTALAVMAAFISSVTCAVQRGIELLGPLSLMPYLLPCRAEYTPPACRRGNVLPLRQHHQAVAAMHRREQRRGLAERQRRLVSRRRLRRCDDAAQDSSGGPASSSRHARAVPS